jgi:hypothetical protein
MNAIFVRWAMAPILMFPTVSVASAQEDKPLSAPEVGQVAPPLGTVQWRHLPENKVPKLADLRSKVVVVHTWVWYCDS